MPDIPGNISARQTQVINFAQKNVDFAKKALELGKGTNILSYLTKPALDLTKVVEESAQGKIFSEEELKVIEEFATKLFMMIPSYPQIEVMMDAQRATEMGTTAISQPGLRISPKLKNNIAVLNRFVKESNDGGIFSEQKLENIKQLTTEVYNYIFPKVPSREPSQDEVVKDARSTITLWTKALSDLNRMRAPRKVREKVVLLRKFVASKARKTFSANELAQIKRLTSDINTYIFPPVPR